MAPKKDGDSVEESYLHLFRREWNFTRVNRILPPTPADLFAKRDLLRSRPFFWNSFTVERIRSARQRIRSRKGKGVASENEWNQRESRRKVVAEGSSLINEGMRVFNAALDGSFRESRISHFKAEEAERELFRFRKERRGKRAIVAEMKRRAALFATEFESFMDAQKFVGDFRECRGSVATLYESQNEDFSFPAELWDSIVVSEDTVEAGTGFILLPSVRERYEYFDRDSVFLGTFGHRFRRDRFSPQQGWHEQKDNQFSGLFDVVEGYKSLGRLRNLEILDFTSNKFNNSIFPYLSSATSLTTLFLRDNHMDGPFPAKELRDLINLELLDLSRNRVNGTIPVVVHRCCSILWWTGSLINSMATYSIHSRSCKLLKYLHLITTGICNLKNMEELDLSRHKLFGQFPSCLTSLSGLRVLDLSSNQMTGKLPSALSNLESLEYLSLFDNNFEGFFSLGSLANLSELRVLKLGSKSNSLQVPHFLLYQKDLHQVDLPDNKISGNFPSWLMENNTELKVLRLQNNYLTSFQLPKHTHGLTFLDVSMNEFNHMFPENIGWILPQLVSMNKSGNGFQGNLPFSLGNMKDNSYVDLSHDSFEGKIPRDFLKVPYSNISDLLLDNNHFTGKIGQGLRSLESLVILDISNNSLTGVIPSWIGELPSLVALLLSNNMLEGEIPMSLFNKSTLWLLDLSANILSGGIPPHIESSLTWVLLLQDNNLSGTIPDTLLMNSINIRDVNIGCFCGPITRQLCDLRNIHLLDLANNKLNGSIPSCFSNTSFGLGLEEDAFYSFDFSFGASSSSVGRYFSSLLGLDPFNAGFLARSTRTKIEFAIKHRYDSFIGENLQLLFGMDISKNELSGEIPADLGALMELQALNLSHNKLSGLIPKSLSGLKNVESLDLSSNRLQGQIPSQLSELSSLAVFNVSFNNLSGAIPQGRQFNTFDSQSFTGNPFLCGQPTNTSCGGNSIHPPDNVVEDEEGTIDMESFYWSFAAAYVTILVGLFASLIRASLPFDSPWSRFWFYKVEVSIHKVRNLLC
ncbi:BnaC02g22730D [Brassica napus]|uniref:BnaC02g22730D protein n=1 Tax=Brassica napus TaxID=3708 RepID=A0A078HVA4_BRANA|nr:BnaC02g22730D [Brassica napus]